MFDIIIIGAGPIGLAAAVEAKRRNLSAIVLDKGVLANSLYHFPTHMTFFTTADLLEIGNHPFPSTSSKPNRQMALDYYRLIAKNEKLNIRQFHRVDSITGMEGNYQVSGHSKKRVEVNYTHNFSFSGKYVIIATGYFDNPNKLDVPGVSLPHVSHYYSDPYQFYLQNVVIIGAGNSGAEAALELYRHGANVTLLHNHAKLKKTLKYWVGPDLRNRIAEKSITAYLPAKVIAITEDAVIFNYNNKETKVPADFVFILIGFHPNIEFLKMQNVAVEADGRVMLTQQYESRRNGVFVIGSAGFGKHTNAVFIENGREHAVIAVDEIAMRISDPLYQPSRFPLSSEIGHSEDTEQS